MEKMAFKKMNHLVSSELEFHVVLHSHITLGTVVEGSVSTESMIYGAM